jgi:hypothetical protein
MWNWNGHRALRYSALCGLAMCVSGCGSLVTLDAWLGSGSLELQNNEGIVAPAPEHLSSAETRQAAKQFALMALFAKVVYRTTDEFNTNEEAAAVQALIRQAQQERFNAPQRLTPYAFTLFTGARKALTRKSESDSRAWGGRKRLTT